MSVSVDSNTLASPTTVSNRSVDGAKGSELPALPHFIKPLPAYLDADDLRYLLKRGCFAFLTTELEKLVIRRYAEFIHPLIPVLDLDEFVGVVCGNSKKKISLLLYHAIMCAGMAAVEIETILKYGFPSKPAARREQYTKAKVLFDLDAEMDRLAVCQAAIMFISWSSSKHSKDAFHWIGIAISQALSLKIQRDDTNVSLPKSERMLHQRIWWTIIMKECDVCLSMGRPPRISPYGTPLLQQEAFTNNARLADYSDLPEIGKLRRDPWIQRRLEMACIEKSKLSLIVYKILRLPRSGSEPGGSTNTRNVRIWQLEAELKDWRLQLPMELTSFNPALNLSDDVDRSLQMTVSIIHLTQLLALIMLHKSEVSVAGWMENQQHGNDWYEDDGAIDAQGHTKSMRQAAYEITIIHKALHDQRMTPSIPTIGVATVCAAVFVHLLDARSAQTSVRNAGLAHLNTCLEVLRVLGQINETATDVTIIVESAVQAAREFSAVPASQKQSSAPASSSTPDRTRSTDELQFTTHSYMEGVTPGRSEARELNAPASAPHDLLSSTGQELFCGMENFFDFELDDTPMFLAEV